MATKVFAGFVIAAALLPSSAIGQSNAILKRLEAAGAFLASATQVSKTGVPQELLARARCAVVVLQMKKSGGTMVGRGFAFCRNSEGNGWSGPGAIRIEALSLGSALAGGFRRVSTQDVLLLILDDLTAKILRAGKMTLGKDGYSARGSAGKDTASMPTAALQADVLTYSLSHGVFAGIAIQGATVREDGDANNDLYGHPVDSSGILAGTLPVPYAAARAVMLLNKAAEIKKD